ncbi:MAG: (4Fe-4S)-binding protein [Desulfovibrionaceae bacterium]|nr:(4Fe-4S)-binding protein [Desulfovibrionaceae bacterium]
MRIAFASGKGGAGKTTLTAQISRVWPEACALADCDVEAPNLHLFLHPNRKTSFSVSLEVPKAVLAHCTGCGQCRTICRYGAIALFGTKIAVFSDMCHGCGGCFAVCSEHALEMGERTIGQIDIGALADGTPFFSGTTRIGEVMTPPLLRRLLHELDSCTLDQLVDGPPGVSCPAVTVANHCDGLVLVVEPTPFGFADFKLAVQAFLAVHKPLVCVINRSGLPGNDATEEAVCTFCAQKGLPIAGRIPFSRKAAATLAQGELLADDQFYDLARAIHAHFHTVCEGTREVRHG